MISYGAVLIPPDRRFWAQLVWSHRLGQSAAPTWLACTSVMSSGALMTTTNAPPSLDPPPDFDVEYHELATVGDTIQRHANRLQAATADCQVIVDPAEAIRNAIRRKLDYHRSRRILVQFDAVALQQMEGSPCFADHGMVESERPRPE